jgi:hypothetical protein
VLGLAVRVIKPGTRNPITLGIHLAGLDTASQALAYTVKRGGDSPAIQTVLAGVR